MTALNLFVVFNKPLDFPRHVVVRVQRVSGIRGSTPIEHAYTACLYDTLKEAMRACEQRGLTFIERAPGDDPPIVGVWV